MSILVLSKCYLARFSCFRSRKMAKPENNTCYLLIFCVNSCACMLSVMVDLILSDSSGKVFHCLVFCKVYCSLFFLL
jgi:hypothetical protein